MIGRYIGILIGVLSVIFITQAFAIAMTTTHYIGYIIINDSKIQNETQELIDKNANLGPFNIWSPPYTIQESDNDGKILKYTFFSNNDNLPFTKTK